MTLRASDMDGGVFMHRWRIGFCMAIKTPLTCLSHDLRGAAGAYDIRVSLLRRERRDANSLKSDQSRYEKSRQDY